MVPPRSDRISRVPPYSRTNERLTRTGLSPTMARLSSRFRFLQLYHWPGPRSLAATNGVSVDVLSSGYLDVSVRRVSFPCLCIQQRDDPSGRVSPFGYPRINVCSRLPMAFRSVPRPSSPLSAKASTRCPFALDCRAVAYRGKPHQHDCSDFTQLILAPCSQHPKAPTTWGQDCNLFTMSNNAAR